jgi:hypothetical protein
MHTLKQKVAEKVRNYEVDPTMQLTKDTIDDFEDVITDIVVEICREETELLNEAKIGTFSNIDRILYLKRLIAHLESIYDKIDHELPNTMSRILIEDRRLRPDIQKKLDSLSPFNLLERHTLISNENNYTIYHSQGDYAIIKPLQTFIDSLYDDMLELREEND